MFISEYTEIGGLDRLIRTGFLLRYIFDPQLHDVSTFHQWKYNLTTTYALQYRF
jgi:hypothetical protein